jgi:hypothetical protein
MKRKVYYDTYGRTTYLKYTHISPTKAREIKALYDYGYDVRILDYDARFSIVYVTGDSYRDTVRL